MRTAGKHRRIDGDRVHLAPGSQRSAGKARPGKIFGRAADRLREHRITDQVVVSLFVVDHQIVGIEVKPQGPRKIGQPEHPGLQADGVP